MKPGYELEALRSKITKGVPQRAISSEGLRAKVVNRPIKREQDINFDTGFQREINMDDMMTETHRSSVIGSTMEVG
jgi:hypothetical protein